MALTPIPTGRGAQVITDPSGDHKQARADSEAAGAAGVPIGGLYSTNETVRIRTY